MNSISPALQFFLDLAKLQAIMARRFDVKLGGLGFSEFIILLQLQSAADEKVRRIDLAESIGLTASGITRLLLPMEKVGYIKRQADDNDARISYVVLAPGGKRRLQEALERANIFIEDILPNATNKNFLDLFNDFSNLAQQIS